MKKLYLVLLIIFMSYSVSFSDSNILFYEPTVKEIVSLAPEESIIIGYKGNGGEDGVIRWSYSITSDIYYYPVPEYLQKYESIEEAMKEIEKNYEKISMVYLLTKEKDFRRLSITISKYKEWKEVDVPKYHLQLHHNSVKRSTIFTK